jgi:hypothetical protein
MGEREQRMSCVKCAALALLLLIAILGGGIYWLVAIRPRAPCGADIKFPLDIKDVFYV